MNTIETTNTDLLENPATTAQIPDAGDLAPLTAFDRCDAAGCSAQAYLRARFTTGLELVFCAHHGHDLQAGLTERGAVIRDDSHLLA